MKSIYKFLLAVLAITLVVAEEPTKSEFGASAAAAEQKKQPEASSSEWTLSTMRRYVITDRFHEHMFIMAPKRQEDGQPDPHGISYSVDIDGTLRNGWSVSGWYEEPRNLFLGMTGRFMVRISEPREMDDESKKEELKEKVVLSFYDSGKLIKSYRFKEIVEDISNGVITRINSKTFVFARDFGQSPRLSSVEMIRNMKIPGAINNPNREVFLLETREGKAFVFGLEDGDILAIGDRVRD